MVKIIIKFVAIFVMSFLCFNQGMNDFFETYIPTPTNIIMITAPLLLMAVIIADIIFKELEKSENKKNEL